MNERGVSALFIINAQRCNRFIGSTGISTGLFLKPVETDRGKDRLTLFY